MERIALVRLQSDTMFSGLQFSSLIRAGFGVCFELSTFLRSCVRSRSALLAENLFLRKQLAFYQEHQVRPRRLTDAARISLVLQSYWTTKPTAGYWEPDEPRGSRPVLRERGGETPPRHSPQDVAHRLVR